MQNLKCFLILDDILIGKVTLSLSTSLTKNHLQKILGQAPSGTGATRHMLQDMWLAINSFLSRHTNKPSKGILQVKDCFWSWMCVIFLGLCLITFITVKHWTYSTFSPAKSKTFVMVTVPFLAASWGLSASFTVLAPDGCKMKENNQELLTKIV